MTPHELQRDLERYHARLAGRHGEVKAGKMIAHKAKRFEAQCGQGR